MIERNPTAVPPGAPRASGHLIEPVYQPRMVASLCVEAGFATIDELFTAVPIAFAECDGYVGSYNDNEETLVGKAKGTEVFLLHADGTADQLATVDAQSGNSTALTKKDGTKITLPSDTYVIVSRDVGLFEMNIPASQIDTDIEKNLYDPIANTKAARALALEFGWTRWASFTSGAYLDDTYAMRGMLGVLNLGASYLKSLQGAYPSRGAEHTFQVPLVSIPQLKALYPAVPL